MKGRRVTHHALARLQQEDPDESAAPDADSGSGGAGLFMEWAVGKQGEIMRANSGKLMLPGAKIIFEVHYHAVGEEITDRSSSASTSIPRVRNRSIDRSSPR